MSVTNTYTVIGMTCDHCVRAVTDELTHVQGVATVDIELATGAVTVTSTDALPREAVADAVDEAGYQLAP
jgi:copper chaperone CopZ